jgi:hypothetical protein
MCRGYRCAKLASCGPFQRDPNDELILQEIEKVEEPKFLHSLLMPWELGKTIAELESFPIL